MAAARATAPGVAALAVRAMVVEVRMGMVQMVAEVMVRAAARAVHAAAEAAASAHRQADREGRLGSVAKVVVPRAVAVRVAGTSAAMDRWAVTAKTVAALEARCTRCGT